MSGSRVIAAVRASVARLASDPPRSVALGLVIVTVACIFIPLSPAMPSPALDDAWALGLNEAVAHHKVFGRDIVFTFGPYASVFSTAYHPATDGLMLLASAYLAGCYGLAIVILSRDQHRYLPWILLAVLAVVLSARDARDALLMSYPLLVGLVCVRAATRTPMARSAPAVVAVLASAFGLLALIKGSMSVVCALVAISVFGAFSIERRWRLAIALVVAPVVALVTFWLLAGQPLTALPRYVVSFLPIMSHYADAMAIPGDPVEVLAYLAGCALLFAAILWDRGTPLRPRLCLLGIYGAFLFVALKAGFVRHDSHALIPAHALLLAATVFVGMRASRLKVAVIAAAVVVWGYIDRGHLQSTPSSLATKVVHTYTDAARGLAQRLAGTWPQGQYNAALDVMKAHAGIPPLDGTTDVYSFGQTGLIASGNRWNPRPVIQSYAAYDAVLADKNRAHLVGTTAPDNIVFRVEPIDARLPALDDGASWPVLWTAYRPRLLEDGMLILRRRAAPAPVTLEVVGQVTGRIARPVIVPASDSPLVAEIAVKPSVLGKLAGALFKSNTLLIRLKLANGQTKTYRYVAAVGAAGVPLSPLVETTGDFVAMYAATTALDAKRVVSFTIEPAGSKRLWQRRFEVTFKRFALRPTLEPRRFHALTEPGVPLGEPIAGVTVDAVLEPTACDGVIDAINGYTTVPGEIDAAGLLSVSGWIARSVREARLPGAVKLVLTDAGGTQLLYATRRTLRPDVGAYYKDARLDEAGYTITIDVSHLTGRYTLTLALEDDGRLELCPRSPYAVTLRAPDPIAAD